MIELALAEEVRIAADGDGAVEIEHNQGRIRLKRLSERTRAALLRLAEPVAWEELVAAGRDGTADSERLRRELRRLTGRGLIRLRCADGDQLLATAVATGTLASFRGELAEDRAVVLSRFACLYRDAGNLVIDAPLASFRMTVLHPSLARLLLEAVTPVTATGLHRSIPELSLEGAGDCIRFLWGVGVLALMDGSGETEEEASPDLAQRDLHDVMLHHRSRGGLTDRPVGGTFPFLGRIPPAPALKPVRGEATVPLPAADLAELLERDQPLARVMEERRSVREHGAVPITLAEIGEFLHRVARVEALHPEDPEAGRLYETTRRPYPAGGATYDLEIYLAVRACDGLEPGFYHYNPAAHALSLQSSDAPLINALLRGAQRSSAAPAPPQVLLVLASRFARLSWKYQGIPYVTTLKNVGVLYATMYLVATAMGLAPCGLGSGDSAVFARLTGLDPAVESSVGEFMLGSMPRTAPPPTGGEV